MKLSILFVSTALLLSSTLIAKATPSLAFPTFANPHKSLITGDKSNGGATSDEDAPSICCPGSLWPNPHGPCVSTRIPYCNCVGKHNNDPDECAESGDDCGSKLTKGEWCSCMNNQAWPCY